jgi:hypothetical protein
MHPRRRAALGLRVALTFAFAVLVHGAIHAAGSGTFVWDSPAHVVMLLAALGLLGGVAVRLGVVGPARERRRRLALVRAGLGAPAPLTVLAGALTQAAIAMALFLPEGIALEPDRIVAAALSGLLALACAAFVFRATRERVLATLVALASSAVRARPHGVTRRARRAVVRTTVAYRLFVPNRPPPAFAR